MNKHQEYQKYYYARSLNVHLGAATEVANCVAAAVLFTTLIANISFIHLVIFKNAHVNEHIYCTSLGKTRQSPRA